MRLRLLSAEIADLVLVGGADRGAARLGSLLPARCVPRLLAA